MAAQAAQLAAGLDLLEQARSQSHHLHSAHRSAGEGDRLAFHQIGPAAARRAIARPAGDGKIPAFLFDPGSPRRIARKRADIGALVEQQQPPLRRGRGEREAGQRGEQGRGDLIDLLVRGLSRERDCYQQRVRIGVVERDWWLRVEVVEDFAGWRADPLADQVPLGDFREEQPGVVAPPVQRFKHHHQPRRLADLGHDPEVLDAVGGLVIHLNARRDVRRHDGAPLRTDALGDSEHARHVSAQPVLKLVGGVEDEVFFAKARVGDEHAHRHAKVAHRLAAALLVFDASAGHAVVFPGGEALVGREPELVNEVVARVVTEHAKMRRVLEFEAPAPGTVVRAVLEFGGVGGGVSAACGGEGGGGGGAGREEVTAFHGRAPGRLVDCRSTKRKRVSGGRASGIHSLTLRALTE